MKSMYNTCMNNVLMKVGDVSGTKPSDVMNSKNQTIPIGVKQIYPAIVYSSQVMASFSRLEVARKLYSLESERRIIKFVASNNRIGYI